MTPLDWPLELDLHDAAYDADLAEDEAYPFPPPSGDGIQHREPSQAMKNALALAAACGRASRYAQQCAGGDPYIHRRVFRWVLKCLTGE